MEENTEKESFKIKKVTIWQGLSAVLGLLLIISIFTSGFRFNNDGTGAAVVDNSGNNNPTAAGPTQGNTNPSKVSLSIGDDPVRGDKNAKITIIEYSDYQCPFCERFYTGTLPQLEEQYIKTGKVKLVYKDYPLRQIHPQAQKAAEAANCALEQNKYWEYHDELFKKNPEWSGNDKAIDMFKQIAKDLKLDSKKFDSCLDKGTTAEIDNDLSEGSNAGISGTPGFYVIAEKSKVNVDALKGMDNGQSLVYTESEDGKYVQFKIAGAYPFETFKAVIDAQL